MGCHGRQRHRVAYVPLLQRHSLFRPRTAASVCGIQRPSRAVPGLVSRWSGPIGQELGQLDVAAGDAVAAAWMLIRAHGTLKTGAKVDYWVRVSNAFRRSEDRWTITHEHVSLPDDMRSRTAVLDLTP
ncbi:MAG: hypothetical protein EOS57_03395 [Mesorhizobium sp.]|nr:MAG: hypothetical protein EOQ43_17635 [Mesorhizobium sp.]RWD22333.1 MAG: hypothetical protein EOS57_03395 [Mesorhizobium sp.]TIU77252.1 MAG: hypothetical protein E5W13_15585 [Mesorhizobium sp.]